MTDLPNDSAKITAAADKAFQTMRDGLVKNGVSNFLATYLAGVVWGGMFSLSILKMALSFALKDIAIPVALEVLKIITDVRNSGGKEFAEVAAAVMGEFMGIEIDPGNLATGTGASAAGQRASAIGGAFIDMLTGSMQGTAPIEAEDGAANAKRFAGYGINFAATNALMSIIAELVSDDHLTQLHELGEDVAHNLGLGRLIRTALSPFVHAAIAQPYGRFVNSKYRGKELSAGEYTLGLYSSRLAEADVDKALSELGYSDDYIKELKLQHSPKLTLHEVDALLRWGKLDQAGAVAALVAQGWPADHAQQKLDALHFLEADREERAYAAEVLRLTQDRMLDTETFANLLDRLHLSDEEKQGIRNRLGVYLDSHHKPLTLNELIFLQERNLITGDEVTAWAEQQGYSPNDQAALDLYVTEKTLEYQQAQAAKAAKAAAAAAKKKGTVPPPKH